MRTILWAALIAGASYCLAAWVGWHGPAVTAWKGSGVALLALWAATQARSFNGWLLVIVMLFGAVGDVLLDAAGMLAGALAFFVGHLVAIVLYLRCRRKELSFSQRLLGLLIAPFVIFIAWELTHEAGVVFYAAGLGVMAALAWTSRYPRYRVGVGAMLFVASDLLIFSRVEWMPSSLVPTLLIWPLYFIGQALIATGVVATLKAATQRDRQLK